ncbi:MAG: hypothetical protein ABI630_01940 [Betaproteobacteria bacterium]
MKFAIRLALLALASTSATAFAQDSTPQCSTIFNSTQNMFSAANAPAGSANRQCFLTVMPKDGPNSLAGFPKLAQYPNPQLQEGTYEILLSGGGGGGGGGGFVKAGEGGDGAIPSKTSQYLSPGIYKLTIGTAGMGGTSGGRGGDGHPTSITKAYTNEVIAGFRGADAGGVQAVAGSEGGQGGTKPNRSGAGEVAAQAGAPMVVAGVSSSSGGAAGMRDGGGGGGAGFGDGGAGKSGDTMMNKDLGNTGGHGFVRLTPIQIAQATPRAPVAAAPVAAPYVAPAPVAYVAPRAVKRDRN